MNLTIHIKKGYGAKCGAQFRSFASIALFADEGRPATCRKCLGVRRQSRYASVSTKGMNLVGKVLHKQWGYNMTNNTYYLITKQSDKSVVAHEIGSKVLTTDAYLAGTETPDPEHRILPYGEHDNDKREHRFLVKSYNDREGKQYLTFVGGPFNWSTHWSLHDGTPDRFNHCD